MAHGKHFPLFIRGAGAGEKRSAGDGAEHDTTSKLSIRQGPLGCTLVMDVAGHTLGKAGKVYGPFYQIGSNCSPILKENTKKKKQLNIQTLDVY